MGDFTLVIFKGAASMVVFNYKFIKCLLLSYLSLILFTSGSAIAAEAELGIRAKVLNLNHLPANEALQMCFDKGWVCQGPCANGPIQDIVYACTFFSLCCSRASPYMELPFDEIPQEPTGEMETEIIDGFTVYE
jgi:hypothetical protein